MLLATRFPSIPMKRWHPGSNCSQPSSWRPHGCVHSHHHPGRRERAEDGRSFLEHPDSPPLASERAPPAGQFLIPNPAPSVLCTLPRLSLNHAISSLVTAIHGHPKGLHPNKRVHEKPRGFLEVRGILIICGLQMRKWAGL